MLLVIVLQRTAVIEIIAKGGLQVETKLRGEGVLCTCRSFDRQLPRFLVHRIAVHFTTHTLLQHHAARDVEAKMVSRPQLPGYAKGDAEIMQLLVVIDILIKWDAEFRIKIGIADAAVQG